MDGGELGAKPDRSGVSSGAFTESVHENPSGVNTQSAQNFDVAATGAQPDSMNGGALAAQAVLAGQAELQYFQYAYPGGLGGEAGLLL